MRDIETTISPFIENQFPAFYKEQGESFILFVKAYFEWLEQNHQLLTLESDTGFAVGDTIAQGVTTGKVIAKVGAEWLVYVDGFDTFKCLTVCMDVTPIVSSSGASTIIKKGGRTKRLGSLFFARNLPQLRDIDKTIDIFIIQFKEKYLKNIEFDTATNQRLLVKNSLNLYRSKGSERSIELFFKLVYGVDPQVHYPGEDLFKLSDGEWVVPKYLEITSTQRSIDLVGKQIKGITSGATAFVEKYVKRKIKTGFVHILFVSSAQGQFVNEEILAADNTVFDDSPRLIGSMATVDIILPGAGFEIGDIVSFTGSDYGDYGLARVDNVANTTGVVDFLLIDGGWGYTTNAQSIVSEKVLTLANVKTSNTVDAIVVLDRGLGYSNTDKCTIVSQFVNATATISTNSTGAITTVSITNPGSGFNNATISNSSILVTNSTGGTTSSNATLQATTKVQPAFFNYFENIHQKLTQTVTVSNATPFSAGMNVRFGNATTTFANAYIDSKTGNAVLVSNVVGTFNTSNTMFEQSNSSVNTAITTIANSTVRSTCMGVPTKVTASISNRVGTFALSDVCDQTINGVTIGTGTIESVTQTDIILTDVTGIFRDNITLTNRTTGATATISGISVTVGVYNVVGTFAAANAFVYSTSGTQGQCISVSTGFGAEFNVGDIFNTETVFLNTDLLNANNVSNTPFMQLPISTANSVTANNAFGFAKNPQGNSSSIIYSCLNFDLFTLGSIGSLSAINPGSGYNIDPYVLVRQPYISSLDHRDFVIEISNPTSNFAPGEFINQSNTSENRYLFNVSDETGYQVGEIVYQGANLSASTANGIISLISTTANTIQVYNVQGAFANGTTLKSVINTSLSATVSNTLLQVVVNTARGIIKPQSNTSVLKVKRINLEDTFVVGQTIRGLQSNAAATILSVAEDQTVLPIGFNASVSANVVTANGIITQLTVVDSGVGYWLNGSDLVQYVSEDGLRAGSARLNIDGMGVGSGYFKSSKGFISNNKYLRDGDYYQEYSYEILTRIPFNKYATMFKKVMHTAGTRFFGSVLIEDSAEAAISYADDVVANNITSVIQFNSNTAIVNSSILFDNDPALLANGDRVVYTTLAGNTAVTRLANNVQYYVVQANATSVQLATNPRALSYSFNPNNTIISVGNSTVNSSFINISRHNLAVNDAVRYAANTGNTVPSGLTNNFVYFVSAANSTGVSIATTRGGANLTITPGANQVGHTLTIAPITITPNATHSGVATNGHFLTTVI